MSHTVDDRQMKPCRRIKLYHGTQAKNVPRVRREGIKSFYDEDEVYLTDNWNEAWGWAKMREGRAAVFQVNVCADRVREGAYAGIYIHQGSIPAADVKLIPRRRRR